MLINAVELRQQLLMSKNMAIYASNLCSEIQKQPGTFIPPSDLATVSIALSLNIIAATAIKQYEKPELEVGT